MIKLIRSIELNSNSFQMDFFLDDNTSNLIYQIENYNGLDYINNVHRYEYDGWEVDDDFINSDDKDNLNTAIKRMRFVRSIWSSSFNFNYKYKRLPNIEELLLYYNNSEIYNYFYYTDQEINKFSDRISNSYETFLSFFYSHLKLMLPPIWEFYYREKNDLSKSIFTCTKLIKKEIDKLLDTYKNTDCYYNFILQEWKFEKVIASSHINK